MLDSCLSSLVVHCVMAFYMISTPVADKVFMPICLRPIVMDPSASLLFFRVVFCMLFRPTQNDSAWLPSCCNSCPTLCFCLLLCLLVFVLCAVYCSGQGSVTVPGCLAAVTAAIQVDFPLLTLCLQLPWLCVRLLLDSPFTYICALCCLLLRPRQHNSAWLPSCHTH
jgi:hypothetical protein